VRGQVAWLPVLVTAPGRDAVTVSDLGVEEACPAGFESEWLQPAKASVARVASRRKFLVAFIR
jgi:hypothetical protein